MAQHFTGLIGVQVRDDDGLDLRVLETDDVGYRTRFHPLQAVETAGVAAQQNPVDQAVCLVLAQCLGEHLADVAVRADADAGLIADHVDELAHHLLDLLAVHVAHLRHGHADPLNLFGAHVAQYLSGVRLTQGEEQNRGFIHAGQFDCSSSITHQR